MNRRCVTSAIWLERRLASEYESRLKGAASPGRWQEAQFAEESAPRRDKKSPSPTLQDSQPPDLTEYRNPQGG
jgi:hypothetical protein